MSFDWVKMRLGIVRDPKTIRMADWLAGQIEFMAWLTDPVQQCCNKSAYEHVTRDVTVALCVTSLLVTWGNARNSGRRDGDDLVLRHCDLDTLDAIAGLPKFGRAMASVGWAKESAGQDGEPVVTLPNYFTEQEKGSSSAAARQARYRERLAAKNTSNGDAQRDAQRDVTVTRNGHVTVTGRLDKTRPEDIRGTASAVPVGSPPTTRDGPRLVLDEDASQDATATLKAAADRLAKAWNACQGVARVATWNEKRKSQLRQRLKSKVDGRPWMEVAIEVLTGGNFPHGWLKDNEKNWKPDLEWFMRPSSLPRVVEGYYDHTAKPKAAKESIYFQKRQPKRF